MCLLTTEMDIPQKLMYTTQQTILATTQPTGHLSIRTHSHTAINPAFSIRKTSPRRGFSYYRRVIYLTLVSFISPLSFLTNISFSFINSAVLAILVSLKEIL